MVAGVPGEGDLVYRLMVRTGLLFQWIFRWRLIVSGEENLPPAAFRPGGRRSCAPGSGAVFAVTHFGYLDFAFAELVLWKHTRAQLRFLITKAAASHWFAGPVIRACGHVVVDRAAGAAAYEGALEKLRAGEYVAVLPEAGVSRSFTVRELKTGAVRLAAEADVPLIPVSVWGAHRLLTRDRSFSLRRLWRAPVRVHISTPIRHTPEADVVQETARLRAELQDGIDRGIADFPIEPPPGAWWQPAHLGGSAMTEAERAAADARDIAAGRYRKG